MLDLLHAEQAMCGDLKHQNVKLEENLHSYRKAMAALEQVYSPVLSSSQPLCCHMCSHLHAYNAVFHECFVLLQVYMLCSANRPYISSS